MTRTWTATAVLILAAALGGSHGRAAPVASGDEATEEEDGMPELPASLTGDVSFWEDIFDRYSPDHCVFHDRDDLGRVYLAKRVPGATRLAQTRQVRRYVAALRGAFARLASGARPANLLERRLAQVTPAAARTEAGYLAAGDNLRCQRGVDLGPAEVRARTYLPMVKKVLARAGLPADLAYLPFLESGYNVKAASKAGARGLWQLMPATARLEGLRVGRRNDQRGSAVESTKAAARLLRDYYGRTGSWPLAITAYNYGINGVRRAIDRYGADYETVRDRHRTRLFGFAARNYYPSFLAARNVIQRREATRLAAASGRSAADVD